MTTLLLLAAAGAAYWLYRRPRAGAGASAAARAWALRTPWVRLATLLGISTRGARTAARWEAGAVGERRTAVRLTPLEAEGWTVLHDRALPRSRANVDHLCISPRGIVVLPDSKRWSARYRLRIVNGRLLHGTWDVTDRLNGLRGETATVAALLGVPVIPLVVMDGPPIDGGELLLDGIRIVPADRALSIIRSLDRIPAQRPPARLVYRAELLLPPYQERSR
jgi:hypothetical protein